MHWNTPQIYEFGGTIWGYSCLCYTDIIWLWLRDFCRIHGLRAHKLKRIKKIHQQIKSKAPWSPILYDLQRCRHREWIIQMSVHRRVAYFTHRRLTVNNSAVRRRFLTEGSNCIQTVNPFSDPDCIVIGPIMRSIGAQSPSNLQFPFFHQVYSERWTLKCRILPVTLKLMEDFKTGDPVKSRNIWN